MRRAEPAAKSGMRRCAQSPEQRRRRSECSRGAAGTGRRRGRSSTRAASRRPAGRHRSSTSSSSGGSGSSDTDQRQDGRRGADHPPLDGSGAPAAARLPELRALVVVAYPSCGHSSSAAALATFFLRPPRSTRGVGAAAAARPPACARRWVPPPLGRRLMLAVERPRCWSRRRSTSVGRNRARAQQQRVAGSVSGEQGGRATTNERGRCRAQQCPALSSSCDGRAPLLRGIDRCSRSVARQRQLSGRDSVAAAGVLQQPAGEPAGCLAACRPAVLLRRSPVKRAAEVERAG